MSPTGLAVDVHGQDDVTFVRLNGRLDDTEFRPLRDRLLKEAAEEPKAIVVDVNLLQVDDSYLLSVFSYVSNRMLEWPGIPLLLAAEDQRANAAWRRSAAAKFVPVFPSTQAAFEAAGKAPHRRRVTLWLPHDPTSSARARRFCDETCSGWGLEHLRAEARAVAAELVENTLQHTQSDGTLRLELRDGKLFIAMSDGSSQPAVLRESGGGIARAGNGLRIVAQLGKRWGCANRLDAGKVVWASIPADRPDPEPGTGPS